MTRVVNAKFAPKAWREDASFVDVRRTRGGRVEWSVKAHAIGYFGNPYPVTEGMPLAMSLRLFSTYAEHRIAHDPTFRRMVAGLAGKTLVCACAPKEGLTHHEAFVCHGQVLADLADLMDKKEAVPLASPVSAPWRVPAQSSAPGHSPEGIPSGISRAQEDSGAVAPSADTDGSEYVGVATGGEDHV